MHSAILSKGCSFFQAAFQGSFKETNTGIIEMDDDDSCALDALLMLKCTGNYSVRSVSAGNPTANEDIRALLLVKYHSDVGLLADKYDVPDLRELASLRVKQIAIQYLPAARV